MHGMGINRNKWKGKIGYAGWGGGGTFLKGDKLDESGKK